MKTHLLIGVFCAVSLNIATAQVVPAWPEVTKEAKTGSRWWWLGSAVDETNLKWNLEQLAQAGIGTLEITPIYGVKGNASKNITFLSTKWLDMLRFCREQGEQLGIDIDMTTGTGWPSGGPMVKLWESACKLATETFDITSDGISPQVTKLNIGSSRLQCVVAFPQTGTDSEVTDLTSQVSGNSLTWIPPVAGKWKVIAAYCQPGVMQVKRPSPGSEGYVVDYFDSTAVANYLKYFDEKFEAGNSENKKAVWPHSFFNDSYEINQADWTPTLLTEFERRRGYRLEQYFDLFLGLKGTVRQSSDTAVPLTTQQVIADYRQTLSDMLLENFTRQWTRWAHSHGATTRNQAHGSPGNLIDLYAEADIPETENFYMNNFGIKGLRNDVGFYMKALSSRATLKYASSAAHITGKKLTSSESMTWLTEHFRTSLSQIKPELDLLFTAGVNHVLFHGTAYSPSEAAWPGWKFYAAIDMSPTNSIWRDAPSMMKYIERVQSFMQMGTPDNDVLVYAPFANAWHKTTGSFQNRLLLFDINTMGTKMAELEQTSKNLETMGLDCDYISEKYLMTTTFTDGQLQTAAGTRYKALVIPGSDNLPDSVKTHLDELAAQGAQVVYGRDANALSALTSCMPEKMRTEMGLSVIRRKNATGHHYFISNLTPNDVKGYIPIAVDFQGAAYFDPMTGDITATPTDDGKIWLDLKSGQSVILQTYDTPVQYVANQSQQTEPVTELAALEIGDKWVLNVDSLTPYQLSQPQTWETLSEQAAAFMGTGIYQTTFTVTAQQLKTATAGFRLNLGDVRESARVRLNDTDLGCAWAVPYILDCRDAIREGENKLTIEVTNLPANRIRKMDIDGTEWRIFEDANIANISNATYEKWSLMPSGLNSKVKLIPMALQDKALSTEIVAMTRRGDFYYPQFKIQASHPILTTSDFTMKDMGGNTFNGFDIKANDDGTATLTITGDAKGSAIVEFLATDGTMSYAYVPAYGSYSLERSIDLTAETAPLGGWQKLTSTSEIKGFSGMGRLTWYRSKSNGREVTLYDGLVFRSSIANYYFYFPGYGMNTNNDFTVSTDTPVLGDIIAASYLQGTGTDTYQAADSLQCFALCDDTALPLSLPLKGNASMTIYRSLALYTPTGKSVGITDTNEGREAKSNDDYYTLQGVRVEKPTRGAYIHKGKIVIVAPK